MVVMYDSFSSCFVETELLGVSVPIKFYVKSVTNDFVDDSLVNNVIDNSDTFIEADMMIGRKEWYYEQWRTNTKIQFEFEFDFQYYHTLH